MRTFVVSNTQELIAALDAGAQIDEIEMGGPTAADLEAVREEARRQGREHARSQLHEVVLAERNRYFALQRLAGGMFDAELQAALLNGTTPEQFAMAILEASATSGQSVGMLVGAQGAAIQRAQQDQSDASTLMRDAMRTNNPRSED